MTARFARSFEDKPQSLLDQIPELAPAQSRLCLGSTVEFVGDFDSGFHGCLCAHKTIKPYLSHGRIKKPEEIENDYLARLVDAERHAHPHPRLQNRRRSPAMAISGIARPAKGEPVIELKLSRPIPCNTG